jgi:enamine deaminase RidA (YjgF/YER057c/UK114 family)
MAGREIKRLDSGKRLSRVVVHGDTAYFSGLTADDLSADVAGQTRQILAKVDGYLDRLGLEKSRLLRAEIWLAHISGFDAMNGVWEDWIDPQNPPARATVETRLAGDKYLVEMMFTAAL